MYQYKKEPFGKWSKISFTDNKTGNGFSLVPDFGATLLELNFKGKNILDSYKTPEQLASGDWSKSAILFPFPNRLNDGKYSVNGKNYQFPINEKARNNALHGLGFNQNFKVKNIITQEDFASISCVYQSEGENEAYPFSFLFEIIFTINNENDFKVEMKFTNHSSHAIPVGLGWHPYFDLGNETDENWLLLPECMEVMVDDKMIPTGEKKVFEEFKKIKKIGTRSLDTCFELKNKKGIKKILLKGSLGKLTYWQEAGDRLWNFFQVFTPPFRKSVAIEPMTCNIDAFNNQDGLVMLESEKTLEGKFGVGFED